MFYTHAGVYGLWFDAGTWGASQDILSHARDATHETDLTLNNEDNAVAVWVEPETLGSSYEILYAKRYRPECGDSDLDDDEECDDGNLNDNDGCHSDCTLEHDDDGDGYYAEIDDCDDTNAAINPGANEVCDGVDNNCNSEIDEASATDAIDWYVDADSDTYGSISAFPVHQCYAPAGYVADNTDCNDGSLASYPSATEVCDGEDNDCNGVVDDVDPASMSDWYFDNDGDGYGNPAVSQKACSAPDRYVADNTDCDDGEETKYPGAVEVCDEEDNNCDGEVDNGAVDATTWYADYDSDGYGNPLSSQSACEQPSGYVANNSDCNDSNAIINPEGEEICNAEDDNCDGTVDNVDVSALPVWYADNDGDGYGISGLTQRSCTNPGGYADNDSDCNDANEFIHPSAVETCNGKDDDCNGTVDDSTAMDATDWYIDADSDGYGDSSAVATRQCSAPAGYVADRTDCDDADAQTNPGAIELCDGLDNNCNLAVDEGILTEDKPEWFADNDHDGFGDPAMSQYACVQPTDYVEDNTDCDDGNDAINPDALEICGDGIDNDCDGDSLEPALWYIDADLDGYGDVASTQESCEQPMGYVDNSEDCDDSIESINPGMSEVCGDGVDNNCDGITDTATTWYADSDGDSFGDPSVSQESCETPIGYVLDNSDCDDSVTAINPDANEMCDGVDNNCDGFTDEDTAIDAITWYIDIDGDGYGQLTEDTLVSCTQPFEGYVDNSNDCDDEDALVNPGVEEVCSDEIDNDCDGEINEDCSEDVVDDTEITDEGDEIIIDDETDSVSDDTDSEAGQDTISDTDTDSDTATSPGVGGDADQPDTGASSSDSSSSGGGCSLNMAVVGPVNFAGLMYLFLPVLLVVIRQRKSSQDV